MKKPIYGFSKLNKLEKIEWVVKNSFSSNNNIKNVLQQYFNDDEKLQKLHDEFAENTLSNFYLPFAIAPNFLINKFKYNLNLGALFHVNSEVWWAVPPPKSKYERHKMNDTNRSNKVMRSKSL